MGSAKVHSKILVGTYLEKFMKKIRDDGGRFLYVVILGCS